ncbi:MAG TPA: PLD nuclease N-terminal domain-containing protein [Nocardioidaceae bacterium]|jgi:hypothetical protein
MRYLPAILMIVLAIYSWVEIAMSDPTQVRQLPRWVWTLVVFVPLLGAICWLVLGRPNGSTVPQPVPKPKPRVVAPDDDPDFLRSLRHRKPPEDQA